MPFGLQCRTDCLLGTVKCTSRRCRLFCAIRDVPKDSSKFSPNDWLVLTDMHGVISQKTDITSASLWPPETTSKPNVCRAVSVRNRTLDQAELLHLFLATAFIKNVSTCGNRGTNTSCVPLSVRCCYTAICRHAVCGQALHVTF